MSKYTGPVCRLCRREGVPLMLKGQRCIGAKCTLNKKKSPPGLQTSFRRPKLSEYGLQLREKQKIRRYYNVSEKYFRNLYEKASRKTGKTGDNLLIMLETRLDSVLFLMNLASSRKQARQLINHGHIIVNEKKLDKPGYLVRAGDAIALKEKSKRLLFIRENLKMRQSGAQPAWIEVDEDAMTGKVLSIPERADIQAPGNETLVVELYSK